MDIISAYREVGTYRGAAAISGTTPKTVKRVIARHAAGGGVPARVPRERNYDGAGRTTVVSGLRSAALPPVGLGGAGLVSWLWLLRLRGIARRARQCASARHRVAVADGVVSQQLERGRSPWRRVVSHWPAPMPG